MDHLGLNIYSSESISYAHKGYRQLIEKVITWCVRSRLYYNLNLVFVRGKITVSYVFVITKFKLIPYLASLKKLKHCLIWCLHCLLPDLVYLTAL